MPRGFGRGVGRGGRFGPYPPHCRNFFGLYGMVDIIFLLLMLYLLFKLFLVASAYVIGLVMLYIIWGFISPGRARWFFGP